MSHFSRIAGTVDRTLPASCIYFDVAYAVVYLALTSGGRNSFMHPATNASVLEHIFDHSRTTCACSGFPEFVVNVFAAAVSISGWLMQFQAIFDIWLPPTLYTTRVFV